MATLEDLVTEVRASLRGFGLTKEQVTFLNGSITNSATSVTVDDGSLVQPGPIEIDSEVLYVQSISSNTLTISPDGRGWDGTTAASHSDNKRVTVSPPFPTWRVVRAINDTITGTYPTLYGVDTHDFAYTIAQDTYDLPADCENILQVTATTIGSSGLTPEIHRYKYDGSAQTITLLEAPDPGQTVTVVYQKAPSEITSGQSLSASGLADTARSCVVYGAVSRVLSFIDATRLSASSANANEYDTAQRVGSATQIAAQLTARYQMELDREQARLRKRYPVRVRWIGR